LLARLHGRSGFTAAAFAIVLVAAALRFWALDTGLPHPLTRPDEEVVLAQTRAPASGQADVQWAIYPSAYVYLTWAWGELGLYAGEALGFFPPGDYLTVLRENPARLILVNRVFSALVGTATVAAVIAVARAALGRPAALAAGLLLATNFLHARDSHAVKPDVLFALGALLSVWAMVPLARRATLGRAAVVGIAIGLTLATKYPAVLLLAPAYLAAVVGSAARGWRRFVPPAALMIGLVAAAVFVATSPFLVLNPKSRAGILSLVMTLLPQSVPGVVTAAPATRPWWEGFAYHAGFSLRYGAGLLPTLAFPIALVWAFVSRRMLPLLGACFAVIYFAVLGTSTVNLARYMTPLTPLLALLVAGMLAAAAERVGTGRARWAALAAAVVLLAAEPLASAIAYDRIAARTDTRVLATEWMTKELPPGANVEVLGTAIWIYGIPKMPPGVVVRHAPPDPVKLAAIGVTHVLTHDHVLPYSHLDPAVMSSLAPHLRLLVEFDPFAHDGPKPIFEAGDAHFIPVHGFRGVVRPGPVIRIYAFEPQAAAGSSSSR
jgi:hypothetical protein